MIKEKIDFEEEKIPTTKIIIELMRHAEKEKDLSKVFDKTEDELDKEIRITSKGQELSQKRGIELEAQAEVSVAMGGEKIRTRETAGHVILAQEDIDPNASLEEMQKYIAKQQKIGKKIITNKRLDLIFQGHLRKEVAKAHKEGKVLNFYLNNSDREAIKYNDKHSTSYSRIAGNIAKIVKRYCLMGNNFNRLATNSEKYEKFGNQLERYLGTQMSVPACFLVKVFEKTGNTKKKKEFLEALGPIGFKETQGIRIEIINQGLKQYIIISYEAGNLSDQIEINTNVIDEIIKDREEFENNFE